MGPLIGNSIDDAIEWSESPNYGNAPGTQPPAHGIWSIDVGGGNCELEEEPLITSQFRPPYGACRSLAEIEQLAVRYRQFPKYRPHHLGFIDVGRGETMVVEQTWGDAEVLRTDDGVLFDTYGGYESKRLRRYCGPDSVLVQYHDVRMDSMRRVLQEHSEKLDLDTMWKMLLSRTPGGEVCQGRDTRPEGIAMVTLQVTIRAPAIGCQWTRWYKDGRPPSEADPVEVRFEPWPGAETGGT